jgi:ATPase family associated with various cellular activities (AAA)
MHAETTFSMFSEPYERALQGGLRLTDAPKPPQQLTEKYRPQCLDDLVGQPEAVARLRAFVSAPYSTAFVLHGETGTGKTSAAVAVANDLGCDPFWAVHKISSGEMDAEAVEKALKCLRLTAPGSGWKVIICDEADSMSAKAKQLWLSALEALPGHSVIIFTTNHVEKFQRRFLDRCESIEFHASDESQLDAAQLLMNRIWTAEGTAGEPCDVRNIPWLLENGSISFRRVVRAFEQARLGAFTPRHEAPVPEPTVSLDLAAKRRQAALKAVATRKARLLQKEA